MADSAKKATTRVTKKAPAAKKAVAKQAVAKKAAAKKAPANKAAAKKAPAKKAPAKRAAGGTVSLNPQPLPPSGDDVAFNPQPDPPGIGDGGRGGAIARTAIGVFLVFAVLVLLLRLGDQERGGPAHGDLSIGDGIPATLYLPVDARDDGDLPDPLPKGKRPPVVVVAHGYSADRASMGGISRSLARAGYAVLNIDFRGHGSNTDRFRGDLRDDVSAAVDWVETSPWVDGEHIAVLGHSMGAGAVLDFASNDARPSAVIPMSGGWVLNDAVTPKSTLLIRASGDPDRIADRQTELASDLAQAGGAVSSIEVGGTDHITILRSSDAMREVIDFLDRTFGIEREGRTPGMDDPRFKTVAMYLLVFIGLLIYLGMLTSKLAPVGKGDEDSPSYGAFVLLAGSLLLTLPFMSASYIDPLPLGAGQPLIIHFAYAGAVLWGVRALARRGHLGATVTQWVGDRDWMPSRQSLLTGLGAGLAVFLLLAPLSGVLHRLVPTPTRFVYWVVLFVFALPFFAAFEALLRRGGANRSIVFAVLGRIMLFILLLVGVAADTVPPVVSLVLPLLLAQYVMLEVFAAAAYRTARNAAVIAVVDTFVITWMVVMLTPVS